MVDEVMKFITEADPEVGEAIEAEAARQRRNLELIASENIVSEPVMMAMGSVLTNKYAEGYPGKPYSIQQSFPLPHPDSIEGSIQKSFSI